VVEEFWPRPGHCRPRFRAERRADAPGRDHARALHEAGGGPVQADTPRPRRPRGAAEVLHVPGEAQAQLHARAGAGGVHGGGAAPLQGVPRQLSEAVHGPRRELGRQPRRPVPADALHARGGGGAPAAHRLRERGQHAPGPRARAREGDGDPFVAGRRPRPPRAPAPRREPAARSRLRRGRLRLRLLRYQGPRHRHPGRDDPA
jgi:hypothetical protein